jgi:serine/threonine-protein kinase CHEK2
MAPRSEKSQLKRPRVSLMMPSLPWWNHILNRALLVKGSMPETDLDSKKPRRSERLSQHAPDKTPVTHTGQLPSPLTNLTAEESSELYKEPTATPPEGRPSQVAHRNHDDPYSQAHALSSPPQDTQVFPSQYVDAHAALSEEVEDEVKEGVWGYLFPLDTRYGGRCLVMRKRTACPLPDTVEDAVPSSAKKGKSPLRKEEETFEKMRLKGVTSGGYLIGRHPECGMPYHVHEQRDNMNFETH